MFSQNTICWKSYKDIIRSLINVTMISILTFKTTNRSYIEIRIWKILWESYRNRISLFHTYRRIKIKSQYEIKDFSNSRNIQRGKQRKEDKEKGASGIPGLPGMLLLLSKLREAGCSEERLSSIFGGRAAEVFGLDRDAPSVPANAHELYIDAQQEYPFSPFGIEHLFILSGFSLFSDNNALL